MSVKSIAVLTSGGDAPGMNAAVRAVARTALSKGMRVIGVHRGYNGLLNGDVFEMNLRSVSDIIHRGGTTLYTARSEEFNTPAGVKKLPKHATSSVLTAWSSSAATAHSAVRATLPARVSSASESQVPSTTILRAANIRSASTQR